MVLLIDTNIILDVLLSRSDFVKESSIIWKLCETEQAKGYISTLTYANMMYIMRKQMTPEQIEDVFRKLKLIFEIADFSSVVLEMAVNMKWKDFEDAIQSATAEYVHADYIITRNIKDFTQGYGTYTCGTFGKNLIAMNLIIKSVILLVKQIGGIYVKRCGNKYFNGIYFKL